MPVEMTTLTNDWQDRTVFLIGGGTSVKVAELPRLRNRGITVAINDAMLHVPWADCAFTIDTVWLRNRQHELAQFKGEKIAAVPESYDVHTPGMRFLLRRPVVGHVEDMRSVCTGENSGFAALSMAILRGAKRIALLGYDMRGPGHFHGGYEWRSRYGCSKYPDWARYFATLRTAANKNDVRVINCNPQSGIRVFPFGKWQEIAE